MANEWQSLLQQSPNIAGQDLIKNFQSAYSTAQEQKKTAYEQYRLQKAQDITSKARRADGTMDWDAMFKLGSEAGIGLDAFNQVHKMQSERRASEVANAQNRMVLESMGYDPSSWDPSAGPRVQAPASGVPYQGPSTTDYGFVAPTAPETQIPQVAPATFSAQGVGETAQTSVAPSAPVQAGPQDVVVPGTVAPASKAGMYQLPAAPMRDPDLDKSEGYYNELWRAQRDPEAMQKLLGAGATGATGAELSTAKMSATEQENLARYLALRGINAPDVQTGLSQLENMALAGVAKPVINPMLGMMSKDKQAEEWGRYNQALAEYPAKVQEARVKLSDAIRTGNYEVLDKQLAVSANKIAQEGNKRAERAQQHELASLTPDANPTIWKEVTRQELGKIQDMQAGYDDYRVATSAYMKDPSLGNLASVAVAKLKANNQPVTMDAIESYIIASGAVPEERELVFKKALRDLDVGSLAGSKVLSSLGIKIGTRAMDGTRIENEQQNLEWDIYRRGGLPYPEYMKPHGKAPTGKTGKSTSSSGSRSSAGM